MNHHTFYDAGKNLFLLAVSLIAFLSVCGWLWNAAH